MPEITYKELGTHLKATQKPSGADAPQAYLLFGEEFLYKKAFETLLDFLILPDERATGCEPVDGAPENIRDAVNRANTYAMLPGSKIIAVQESRIFYGNQEKDKLIDKARDAYQGEDLPKAAKYVLSLLGQRQLSLEDVTQHENLSALLTDEGLESEIKWFQEVINHCVDQGFKVPSSDRPDQFLAAAIEKGFPKGNYLVLTADLVDKRRVLFKCFKENGMVVDCSVPKGDRRADRLIQEEVLRERMTAILDKNKKSMNPRTFELLQEMTGFDLRMFSNNLEKLVLYTGERTSITEEDVRAVLERSKQDPVYALTGALSDRSPEQSLKLLDSLLQAGLHPLQVFTAIANQFRKLILAKCFIRSSYGREWQSSMPYNAFMTAVLPAMSAHDQKLVDLLSEWDDVLNSDGTASSPGDGGGKRQKKKKKGKPPEDLLVAANPKNSYPIFLTLQKADNFSMAELKEFHILLSETDFRLKRSALNPKLILEETILRICQKR